jgi:hypothetical protein
MTEQEDRLYAASLLNRADVAFDARDTAVVGKVISVLEADVADLLKRYAGQVADIHSAAPTFLLAAASQIAEGRHRPAMPSAEDQEMNRTGLSRELDELEAAIARIRKEIEQ